MLKNCIGSLTINFYEGVQPYINIKFFPAGTLFACTHLYILGANKVAINLTPDQQNYYQLIQVPLGNVHIYVL